MTVLRTRSRILLIVVFGLMLALFAVSPAAGQSDTAPPSDSTILSPAVDNENLSPPIVLSGTATDETSIDEVRIWIRQLGGTRPWLHADGSFAQAQHFFSVDVDMPGALESTWNWEVPHDLPGGPYYAVVRAVDTAGNRQDTFSIRRFRVVTSDTTRPSASTITAPAVGANIVRGLPTIRGTATDETAIESVRIWIRQIGVNGLWLQSDGSLSTTNTFFSQQVNSPGSPTSNWVWDQSIPIPDGRYRVIVRAIDSAGNQQAVSTTRLLTVDTDDPTLTSTVIDTTNGAVDNPIRFSGRANDDEATRDVRIFVRQRLGDKLWLQADGSFGQTVQSFDALVSSPGARSSLWEWTNPFTLPPGQYVTNLRPRDTAGNLGTGSLFNFTIS